MERALIDKFYDDLCTNGFLNEITKSVINDVDLDMQFRGNYINIYYKGNSLLKLENKNSKDYLVKIDNKFINYLNLPNIFKDELDVDKFINQIPFIKKNIINNSNGKVEGEYEQLIIRANNYENKLNTHYIILDRQYNLKELKESDEINEINEINEIKESKEIKGQIDIIGFNKNIRKQNMDNVPLSIIEVKHGLNRDIKKLDTQLKKYYDLLKQETVRFAEDMKNILYQKKNLGLITKGNKEVSPNLIKQIKFSENINNYEFIVILIDYNPKSELLDINKLKTLKFANQIKIYNMGFGMFNQN